MKDYQITAIIAAITGLAALVFCAGGYYANTYSFAATALLCAMFFSFAAIWLMAEAVIDYRAARRINRWSAK